MLSVLAVLACALAAARAAVLVDFPVTQPPVVPQGVKSCTVHVLTNNFDSFGNPAVVTLAPPTDCGPVGSWSAVTLNYTTTANGTQFDRLSAVTFHNVEIWRTSTFEPTTNGILWTAVKDVSRYIPLFAKTGTLILDLNNIVDPNQGLTGEYLVTLSATYFASSRAHPPPTTANSIIPISNLSPDQPNYVSVPPALDLGVTFPRNAVKAFAEMYASGNGNEEFWYFNTANEFLGDLPAGATFGNGPLRELRLLVDGRVAGTALPWPIIFTGGILPTIWMPISSYRALDQPTYPVDLTPLLPILTDGKPHNISVDVVSAETNGTINQNWFVSANIHVFTDPSGKPTTGEILSYEADLLPTSSATGHLAANGDLNVTVSAQRRISITSRIVPGSGAPVLVQFTQDLQFTNTQMFLDNTFTQNVNQLSTGTTRSTHNGVPVISDVFAYPLTVDFSEALDGNSFTTVIDHTYTRSLLPLGPVVPSSTINMHQRGNGSAVQVAPSMVTGNGTNVNQFSFADANGNTFAQQVAAQNATVLFDHTSGTLSGHPLFGTGDTHPFPHVPALARGPPRFFRGPPNGGR